MADRFLELALRNSLPLLMNNKNPLPFLKDRYPTSRRSVVGVDGGGTKTHAVILDINLNLLGEGLAGPSNPLRVGVVKAATAIREAVDNACDAAHLRRTDLAAAEVG